MNTLELKAYILNQVKDAKDVDIMMNDDDSFYLQVEYHNSHCGALFSESGRMHSMAGLAFDEFETELMDEVKDAVSKFMILKKRSREAD